MKEREVRNFVSSYMCEFWQTIVTWNRKLPGTSIIPDLFFVFRGSLMLIEIDEYAHSTKAYALSDPSRIAQIQKIAPTYRRVYLIRFNPDAWPGGARIWTVTRHLNEHTAEVYETVQENTDEKEKRFGCLREVLRGVITEAVSLSRCSKYFVEPRIEVIKLFYG